MPREPEYISPEEITARTAEWHAQVDPSSPVHWFFRENSQQRIAIVPPGVEIFERAASYPNRFPDIFGWRKAVWVRPRVGEVDLDEPYLVNSMRGELPLIAVAMTEEEVISELPPPLHYLVHDYTAQSRDSLERLVKMGIPDDELESDAFDQHPW